MNLLVKVAKDKYITILKQPITHLEACKITFEKHIDEAIKGFEYHKWRQERYYNEKVDNFLKSFLPLLDGLYLSWAKQKGPRKKDVWMLLDEFNSLITSFVDINEYPIRDNPLIYNQSITLQVNEIYTDKHVNMLLPEFLEALCRAIDKASPQPPGDSKEDWPMEKRKNQPLINKLENILPTLIKLITHPDLKNLREKFPMPPKDLITGLYTPNFDNPFYQGYIIKPGEGVKKQAGTRGTNTAKKEDGGEKKEGEEEEEAKEGGEEVKEFDDKGGEAQGEQAEGGEGEGGEKQEGEEGEKQEGGENEEKKEGEEKGGEENANNNTEGTEGNDQLTTEAKTEGNGENKEEGENKAEGA